MYKATAGGYVLWFLILLALVRSSLPACPSGSAAPGGTGDLDTRAIFATESLAQTLRQLEICGR